MKQELDMVFREPRYGFAEASRLVGMSTTRVRRWLKGYRYSWDVSGEVRLGKQGPIVHDGQDDPKLGASFFDLIELIFARAFVEKGIPIQRIRSALFEAKEVFELDYPFAHRRFFTDGSEIYLEVKKEHPEQLLQLFSGGQWVIPEVIHAMSEQITFDSATGMPLDWWPRGKDGGIIVNPRVSFGAPTLASIRIKTSNIYDLFRAENRERSTVAQWYGISEEDVYSAVEFEEQLLVA